MNGAEAEYISEEVAAAAQKQLESFNKSMEMNDGQLWKRSPTSELPPSQAQRAIKQTLFGLLTLF